MGLIAKQQIHFIPEDVNALRNTHFKVFSGRSATVKNLNVRRAEKKRQAAGLDLPGDHNIKQTFPWKRINNAAIPTVCTVSAAGATQ